MGLLMLQNSCLKSQFESKCRLPIPEFSGYYCNYGRESSVPVLAREELS